MSNPYWGQLPGPKTVRRSSQDSARPSLDVGSRYPPSQPRSKRVSVQTTQSEAPTESTQSPFASPIASSFQGVGLAPRPPSISHHAKPLVENEENGRRRRSRIQETEPEYHWETPPPAAPEVPRAPPLSYKKPFGNGGLPYTYPAEQLRHGEVQRRGSGRQGSWDQDRPKYAEDRSPLQRLELTLDSITKEEKRARVEAAERAARGEAEGEQRATRTRPTSQAQVRSREQEGLAAQHVASTAAKPTADERSLVSQKPSNTQGSADNATAVLAPELKAQREKTFSGLPQRNLSFRERVAAAHLKAGQAEGELSGLVSPVVTMPTGPPGLVRMESNKLRKKPPGRRNPEEAEDATTNRAAQNRSAENDADHVPFRNLKQLDLKDKYTMADRYPAPSRERAVSRSRSVRVQEPGSSRGPVETRPARGRSNVDPEAKLGRQPDEGQGQKAQKADGVDPVSDKDGGDNQDDDDEDTDSENKMHFTLKPAQGTFQAAEYLDEWKKATVGTLGGSLVDLTQDAATGEKWETPGSRRRGRKAEAFDGEYDEKTATRFKPPLHLKCGPLVRYCGLRAKGEVWRGSIMIVTADRDSSYDIAPTLRLFVQPVELLPPPPTMVDGELPPEFIDPLAGHPKLGRKGETLHVRPVDHVPEGKDVSLTETDEGLFEKTKRHDAKGSFAARRRRGGRDGETLDKYQDVRGFRLHAERGLVFWRFNVEVQLGHTQQRIAYRINRGPPTAFWVPARGHAMNVMFHSCNGFSLGVAPDGLSGPDPMWRDVLNMHQSRPFHVMIGGGHQMYSDACTRRTNMFQDWLKSGPLKDKAPFTAAMQDELESFYLGRYCACFSRGLFGMANAQIPMVNMYDDHDIIGGFGSHADHVMSSPVLAGLGNVAFKYYMLFQHQTVPADMSEPSCILGVRPGPYIAERSRSVFVNLGARVALLAVDTRTERTRDHVVCEDTWKAIMDRCYADLVKGRTQHLLVLLGLPLAYPRRGFGSRFMEPMKAKTGLLGQDDHDDDDYGHWTSNRHKEERRLMVEDLQDLAADKSVRVTVLSGHVRMAAVGRFYSNPKLKLPKHKDFRYMANVISSPMANAPASDVLSRPNKVHHMDYETDEDMMALFAHDVDGEPPNNNNKNNNNNIRHLLPRRNWCWIREHVPGNSPPATPGSSTYDLDRPAPTGLLRRLSSRHASGRLLGAFSRRRASMSAGQVGKPRNPPGFLRRTLSSSGAGRLFGRRSSRRPDDGGINGQWGQDDDDEDEDRDVKDTNGLHNNYGALGLRGGSRNDHNDHVTGPHDEFCRGDESHFSVRQPSVRRGPNNNNNRSPPPLMSGASGRDTPPQRKQTVDHLDGALEVCLNAEVNPLDPAGITVPYRLLVPRLWYQEEQTAPTEGKDGAENKSSGGIRRFLSSTRNPSAS